MIRSMVTYATPEQAAVAPMSQHEPEVLLSASCDRFTAVLIRVPAWPDLDLTICRRETDGWREAGGTDGRLFWTAEDYREQGAVFIWGELLTRPGRVLLSCRGQASDAAVAGNYYLWACCAVSLDEARKCADTVEVIPLNT